MNHTPTKTLLPPIVLLSVLLIGCAPKGVRQQTPNAVRTAPLLRDALKGNIAPVHDPALFIEHGTYYVFSSDPGRPRPGHFLPIRCSADGVSWRRCGQVFGEIPGWIRRAVPAAHTLWAPDISYFSGLYHVYYAASTLGSQNSVIGLATNSTLDPVDPKYAWVDRGEVLASHNGGDWNAIDPNVFVDRDGRVWLTYGSYWSGIKQRELDPSTGMILASNKVRYRVAARPHDGAVEGASLVRHGSFYYLFLSVDHCCERDVARDDYKEVVGRSASPNGPFVDGRGVALRRGGGSILLQGNERWAAPGGATVFMNQEGGDDLIVFHALDMADRARPSLWMKRVRWENDWPVLM